MCQEFPCKREPNNAKDCNERSRGSERHDRLDTDRLSHVKNLTCKLYFASFITCIRDYQGNCIAMTVKNKQKSIKLKTKNTRRKKGEKSEILKQNKRTTNMIK